MKRVTAIAVVVGVIVIQQVEARPQYSAAKGINDCTACHYSPVGGGHKTVFGKITASHGFAPAKHSMQDRINGEFRAMALAATKDTKSNPEGISLMSGNVSAAVDIMDNADGTTHIVAGYDFAGFASQAKDIFVRWQSKKRQNFIPQHVVMGKFNIPFGIVTDEHYTYVRQQTKTSENDYEMGGMVSGTLSTSTHYDLAIVQGFQNGGSFPSNGTKWGIVPNIRFILQSLKMYVGISGLYYKSHTFKSPWATAAYLVWAPSNKFSVMLEVDYAKNMNNANNYNSYLSKFVDSTASATYYNELQNKNSVGAMLRFDYIVNNKWTIYNKTDFLAPDEKFLKDNYVKNSVGFKYYINSNSDVELSYEKKFIARDGIEETGVSAGKDLVIALGHVWF